jgi:4-diphosphocytidyl-2C-methyl-D-erythritol kinase
VLRELAYAKLNLVLQVGRPRGDGLHPVCSIVASIELADEVIAEPSESGEDSVECEGVPGDNLAARALAEFRARARAGLPPLAVTIHKRVPVAAGLGGGSADAAAMLRIANRLAGDPLTGEELLRLAAGLGSDVPAMLEPGHTLVQGTGERVEPLALPALSAVLIPDVDGLSTGPASGSIRMASAGSPRATPPTRSTTTFSRPPCRSGPTFRTASTRSPPRAPWARRSAAPGPPASACSPTAPPPNGRPRSCPGRS